MYDLVEDPWESHNLLNEEGEFEEDLDLFQKLEAMEQKVYLDKIMEFMDIIKRDRLEFEVPMTLSKGKSLNDLYTEIEAKIKSITVNNLTNEVEFVNRKLK